MIGINQLTKTNYSLIGVDFTAIILHVQIPLPDCRIGEMGNTSYLKSLSPIKLSNDMPTTASVYTTTRQWRYMYKFVLRYVPICLNGSSYESKKIWKEPF